MRGGPGASHSKLHGNNKPDMHSEYMRSANLVARDDNYVRRGALGHSLYLGMQL